MLPTATAWTQIALPTGWSGTGYGCNVWSWVSYEINPDGSESPVDVLLLSNATDGMVMLRGDTMAVSTVTTPKKFGVIERYAERIWGGAINDDPDMLVYSAPYDPTDWTANVEIPEDGAGDVLQPSWDGDSFTALRAFGSQLIAFKRSRVWRVLGTDPGEYAFKEQYGGGAPYCGTIAVATERILMLDKQGLVAYDGLAVQPFAQSYAKGVFRRMNVASLDQANACLWHGKYYLALPLNSATSNNAVLIYDTVEGTWLLREDVAVEAFLPTENDLYFTSASTPGRIWRWQENSWLTGSATTGRAKWVTPWNDLGYRQISKGGFEVYVLCEVKQSATITVSIQTEKKTKTKTLTVAPLTADEISAGKEYKQKRLHFGGTGRRFRLIIEGPDTGVAWRLVGGVLTVVEIDPD